MSSDASVTVDGVDFDDVATVNGSVYRRAVVTGLRGGPARPSTIAREFGHGRSHVSRALTRLRAAGVVELLVSEDRKRDRYYRLTDYGESVAEVAADHRDAAPPASRSAGAAVTCECGKTFAGRPGEVAEHLREHLRDDHADADREGA